MLIVSESNEVGGICVFQTKSISLHCSNASHSTNSRSGSGFPRPIAGTPFLNDENLERRSRIKLSIRRSHEEQKLLCYYFLFNIGTLRLFLFLRITAPI